MDFLQPRLPDHPLGVLIDNRYQIQKLLGRGGFGQTYLAFDTQCFNHPCVLKEFAPASQSEYAIQKARQLFEREARVLYEIDHPQIPKFLAWFVDRGRLFLVQEYIVGKTYAQLLRQRQQQGQIFSEVEVVQWLVDLLSILQYLHQRQIVHRDISPDNVMLPDQDTKPILIDFGLVKQTLTQIYSEINPQSRSFAEPASFVGKFGYAPPEQIRMGQCFPCSDLYALGVTALVLLTGQEPRLLMDQTSLEWQWREQMQVNDRLAQILERMVQEKPKARYQSVEEVLTDLQPLVVTLPLTSSVSVYPSTAVTAAFPPDLPTAAFADLDPAFLERCQQELTSRIGPIASFVLENTLAQHPYTTPEKLVDALTLEIPDLVQANAFKVCLSAILKQSPQRSTNSAASYGSTAQKSASYRSAAQVPAAASYLSPAFLERCQQALTRCIGPVAALILEDVLAQDPQLTPQQFVEAILLEIPSPQQAEAFQKLMQ